MKKTESKPDSQLTAFSPDPSGLNDIFREILPVLFHKLKNKLTPVIGYSQILKSRAVDDFSLERLAKIENNAAELTDCLNVMKDYFKAPPARKRTENINRIVEKLKADWHTRAAENQINLRISLDPQLPDLPLHSAQITLLLQNLTANASTALAMKACADREILLATRCQDGRGKLIVRDNGIGISPEELNNIWSPFYAKFPGGAGLGLVICERILSNHGAECQVRSQPGKFTEFEITFPLQQKTMKKKIKKACKGSIEQKIKEDA